ncbi:MAG: tetratricopeptide repeat protein [Phycisphaerales bacterium JB063]
MTAEPYHALTRQASLALHAGQPQQALAVLDRLAASFPEKGAVHALRAEALRMMGQLERAYDEARIAVGLDPNSIIGHQALADTAWGIDRLSQAQQSYEKILELEVDADRLAQAWVRYALFMSYERAPRVAEKAAMRAIDVAPDQPDAWAALGMCQFRDRRADEAERSLNEALQRDPESVHARWVLANIFRWTGQDEKAEAMAKLLEAQPAGAGFASEITEHLRKKRYTQGIKPA